MIGILGLFNVPFVNTLPLANFGLNWFVPAAIAAILGFFVPSKKKIVSENK